jgi:hypothetical protein
MKNSPHNSNLCDYASQLYDKKVYTLKWQQFNLHEREKILSDEFKNKLNFILCATRRPFMGYESQLSSLILCEK